MSAKDSKKQRKVGRNAVYCKNYKNRNVRERNKIVRLRRHLARFGGDRCATTAVDRAKAIIGIK